MSVFSMSLFPDGALKEIDFDAASDSTASGCMMSELPSLPTTPDRFFPPGLAAVDAANLSSQESSSGESSTPSEADVDAAAVDLPRAGSVLLGMLNCNRRSVPHTGANIYSSPPPGLHAIPAHVHVARPAPGLERKATEALPLTGVPAPPPELPPISLLSAPALPEVPAWAAAGASELTSEPFAPEPLPWDANMSPMGSFPFTNPVPGWSACVVSDRLNSDDVSLKIADFARHHVRENSPDRKRNLRVNGGLQSCNLEGGWPQAPQMAQVQQQVPQISQVDNFNWLQQNDQCHLAGGGAPMSQIAQVQQQVPQPPPVDNFNWLQQNDQCHLAGGAPMSQIAQVQQQVPQPPQVDNFNWVQQNDQCHLAGDVGAPMWNGCEGWLQGPDRSHNADLSQPPNSNGTYADLSQPPHSNGAFCPAQQLSSAYNSNMYQESNFNHNLGRPQELYLSNAFGQQHHHVDHQEFTGFMGDFTQNYGGSQPWDMQTYSRQDPSWAPAFFGPGSTELY